MITAMPSGVLRTISQVVYMAMATAVHLRTKQAMHTIITMSTTYTALPAMGPMAHHILPTTVGLSMSSTSHLIMKSMMVCTPRRPSMGQRAHGAQTI